MQTSPITQAIAPKQSAQELKATICQLLKWSELQYADFQYETGIAYLQNYIPENQQGIDKLIRERIFWQWWKNNWMFRDLAYSEELDLMKVSLSARITLYRDIHNPKVLAAEIYPNGMILGAAYAQTIKELHN